MSEQDVRIDKLEKEIEILKKRVDYFYEEIRPYIVIDRCKYKHVVSDEKRNGHICYEKQDCFNCEYLHKKQKEGKQMKVYLINILKGELDGKEN